ncbi:N-acetylmuramoyl-L-alanine amidase [Paenibacillus sp. EKM208P]|nr:N-acetylmuramoyl-L-alanine amidase [Paenibacillus sp. EKM208P]
MIQQGNFLLMERDEFRDWLGKQNITRKIDRTQVHHTASPNYSTRKIFNGVAQQDHFVCLEGMRNYHVNTEGWSATGQNITTFEDGKIAISLDRDLNKTPAGIRNSNTGAICIENVGCFDIGADNITDEQHKTIIHVHACLCEKFNHPVDTNHIVYHAWYTYSGERLSDYTPGKSSKSCPGTNFWGDGNTVAAAKKNFLPQIQEELNRLKGQNKNISKGDQPMTIQEQADFQALQEQVKQLTSKLSLDMIPDWATEACIAAKNAGAVDTTSGGSYDFYRLITVMYRKGFFN